MAATAQSSIAVIGIDIGKNSFHVVGLDGRGAIVLRQKWSRGQVEARFANMSPWAFRLLRRDDLRKRAFGYLAGARHLMIPAPRTTPFVKKGDTGHHRALIICAGASLIRFGARTVARTLLSKATNPHSAAVRQDGRDDRGGIACRVAAYGVVVLLALWLGSGDASMTAARELFGKSYFSLGLAEKAAVDQAVVGNVSGNFEAITPVFLAGQQAQQPVGFWIPAAASTPEKKPWEGRLRDHWDD